MAEPRIKQRGITAISGPAKGETFLMPELGNPLALGTRLIRTTSKEAFQKERRFLLMKLEMIGFFFLFFLIKRLREDPEYSPLGQR